MPYLYSKYSRFNEAELEARSACFDAEDGYNMLNSSSCEYHNGAAVRQTYCFDDLRKLGNPLGVFVLENQVVAAYVCTKQGGLLIKNPLNEDFALTGKRNALLLNDKGDPVLMYFKDSSEWAEARLACVDSNSRIDEDQAELDIKNLPDIHLIATDKVVKQRTPSFPALLKELAAQGLETDSLKSPVDLLQLDLNKISLSQQTIDRITDLIMTVSLDDIGTWREG